MILKINSYGLLTSICPLSKLFKIKNKNLLNYKFYPLNKATLKVHDHQFLRLLL